MAQFLLLEAFEGTNKKIPVWFMRQAGRYLPEYQRLKAKYSLEDLFKTPDLAAQITCMPIGILGVDAAILFADILTLPAAMGFDIKFDSQNGPIVNSQFDIKAIHDFKDLSHVTKAIHLANQSLPKHIPLIGFAGSPYTVLTYLLEGGSSVSFHKTLRFIEENEKAFHAIMEQLTHNTIRYFQLQKEAGIKVFQLFDPWAGQLRAADYAHWVLPCVKHIFKAVDLPSIYFVKNSNHLLSLMDQTQADFLSVDHTVILGHNRVIEKTKKGIQGNLFNGLLYADKETLEREIHDV
ncbi:MAG: uroporphyrinogen decarboxylase family protein, partial [Candidatus Omnitrophota bacterium]|nr:uroporphyrinogen decarboxylase family protein [Candidatus Omnitrophota bacterium]